MLATVTDKRLKTYEYTYKENKWRDYLGSSKETENYIAIKKDILMFARSNRELTYLETKTLFSHSAIEDPKCLNISILNKFFRGKTV